MPTPTFADKYPNIDRFVEEFGWIEIGDSEEIDAFVRAYDEGATVYEGKASYPNLEAAFADLEAAIEDYFDDLGI